MFSDLPSDSKASAEKVINDHEISDLLWPQLIGNCMTKILNLEFYNTCRPSVFLPVCHLSPDFGLPKELISIQFKIGLLRTLIT
jgi:hypothetical protein